MLGEHCRYCRTRGEGYRIQKCRSTRSFLTSWLPLSTTVFAWKLVNMLQHPCTVVQSMSQTLENWQFLVAPLTIPSLVPEVLPPDAMVHCKQTIQYWVRWTPDFQQAQFLCEWLCYEKKRFQYTTSQCVDSKVFTKIRHLESKQWSGQQAVVSKPGHTWSSSLVRDRLW